MAVKPKQASPPPVIAVRTRRVVLQFELDILRDGLSVDSKVLTATVHEAQFAETNLTNLAADLARQVLTQIEKGNGGWE